MRDEYDFSSGERGKFYHPNSELDLPIYLDPDVATALRQMLSGKEIDIDTLVNDWLRKNLALIETVIQ